MRFIIIFLLSAFGLSLQAQPVISPIEYNPVQAEHYQKHSSFKISALTDTIDFPFFDDFTTSSVVPDTALWIDNGGTYINSSYAIDPPNFNVATFDGLKANGTPYNTSNPSAIGLADNLTSRPIDLSGLWDKDSIYLNFYWQADGIGEFPDSETDSIRLLLKNRNDVWEKAWSQTIDSTAGFQYQKIIITDSAKYFYKGFQFRFENYGRLSGSFDVWNIDYVMLDTGMLAADNWTPDYSFTNLPTSLLKNYTAMPFSQFRLSELADTVKATVKTLNNKLSGNKVIDDSGHVLNIKTNTILDTIPEKTFFLNAGEESEFIWKVDSNAFNSLNNESIIQYKFTLDSINGDPRKDRSYHYFVFGDNAGTSRIDFQRNDSIKGITYLTDYFSYDDGSAEFGFGVNQNQGKVAVRYVLNEPDSLTHINIYFPRIGTERLNEPISLRVWSDLQVGTSNATILDGQTVPLSYSSALNVFKSYELDDPVYLPAGEFYVGYQQSSDYLIFTGFDKNNDARGNIFFNINGIWQEFQSESGAVMIRPVFKNQPVTGIHKKAEELKVDVFPNPSKGEVFIAGAASEAYLYDLSGKLLFTESLDSLDNELKAIDISSLPNGFYLLHLVKGEKKAVKKIVLNR